ncbi:hypothetical protein ACJMK2_016727 [Sinanodonta woodiana]|uniref:BZIP domain-containing protein n=1 Tax=Sinanodonta woodiana TaxID=1069815 RepID=A0ABD3UUM3_SINWO
MSQTIMAKPESSFPNEEDTSCLRTDANAINKRGAERRIPDHHLAEYLERRKKNNIAAKKSLDNKRVYDQWHRNRYERLMEENALLRQENYVMKARFGTPTDTSILTDDKRENCLMINRTYTQDKGKAVDNVVSKEEIAVSNSLEHCRVDDSMNEYADCENSRNGKVELDAGQGVSVYTPLGGGVLAIPSHVQSLQQYPSAHPGYFDAMPNAISSRKLPVATQSRYVEPDSPCSTERSDSDLTYQAPLDLSVNSTSKYETSEKNVSHSPELNKYDISPDPISDQNRQLKNENDEIKKKLEERSEQVSTMQHPLDTKQEHSC